MAKTIEEINEKIKNGKVVVLNAEEIIDYAEEKGTKKTAKEVDVVTTATFGPMCSSGAFINFGHPDPPIKMTKVWLNDVPACAGIAAVNVYQNYAVATNSSNRTIYTYMGKLLPNFGNATYCSAGQLSPLLNDPYYRTIGIGTRIFLAGGQGYVSWYGTQHNPGKERLPNGTPVGTAGTLAVIGNLKEMSPEYLRACTFQGYGVSIFIGIGIPIPVIDEEMVEFLKIKDEDVYTEIFDYSVQRRNRPSYGRVNYHELRSGKIKIKGKSVQTGSISSYSRALEISNFLKKEIKQGKFYLTSYVAPLPAEEKYNTLDILSKEEL